MAGRSRRRTWTRSRPADCDSRSVYNTSRWLADTGGAGCRGYYPQQIRRDGMPGVDHRRSGGSGTRPAWARLVSDRLRERRYRSYLSGKWHVDGDPLENGFDRSYWVNNRAGFFHLLGQRGDASRLPDVAADQGLYLTEVTADSRHRIPAGACCETCGPAVLPVLGVSRTALSASRGAERTSLGIATVTWLAGTG